MNASLKALISDWLPPVALDASKALLDLVRPSPYEFVGYSWPDSPALEGWSAEGVAENREQVWQAFLASMQGSGVLGMGDAELAHPRHLSPAQQSLFLSFGYCLGLACQGKEELSLLDWGGATGNYYVVGRKLFPDLAFRYHCAELPAVCAVGRRLLPEVTFHDSESWREERYDFVFSSGSLQYLDDWRPTVAALAGATGRYLYITRMPFVVRGRSFVMVQRAACYRSSYLGWVLNRQEFIDFVENQGMRLVRQFVNHAGPRIKRAPEPNLYMGFLFEKQL